ncbi:MAG: 4-hydroxy-3-methylbut-2-enyl diphosphate reductase, partial [Proteobacteria bacterium]|nr:4-hydroxy-3-methylbut-2-enyl diphosphate reductase [Pseudomonadota bacterium]
MGRKFEIPTFYRSPLVGAIKQARRTQDPRKKDFGPLLLDAGSVSFKVARHFGFCFGVENAIEIAYRALEENPGKRVFLLSEMIHNPQVNADLQSRGVKFLQSTDGTQLIPFSELSPDDVVIVPAFGTTREL